VTASRSWLAAVALAAVFATIYLPDIGHGFIKDDFRWIRSSRVIDAGDAVALFATNVGFYRPIVSLTFAADYAVSGLNALGYGITNLTLLLAGALLLFWLARRFAFSPGAALFTVGVWLLNFHAVNMALLWVSGRTSLLVVVFALATAHTVLRRQPLVAGLFALAAMLCKEEATVLPLLFAAYVSVDVVLARARPAFREVVSAVIAQCWPMAAALAIYAALRSESGAFDAFNAPSYYQLSLSPALLLRNVAEYADRAGTTAAAAVLLLVSIAGAWRLLAFTTDERRAFVLAAAWIPATYAVTVFLPVRSSLYALLPSVGAALAAGAVASCVSRVQPARFMRAATVLIIIVAVLVPIYRIRNQRWVRLADLSASSLATVRQASPPARIALVDATRAAVTLDSVFGSVFPDAVALTLGESSTGTIVQAGEPLPPDATHILRLVDGVLVAGSR
jgi:hypothetical protein